MTPERPYVTPSAFDIDSERGFLPSTDPLGALPPGFEPWEEAARNMPKILVSDRPRALLESLPPFDAKRLKDDRELRRAMVILSYLGHAYVWGESEPSGRIPTVIAVPWHDVSARLGRPPVLSYVSYALDNWRRIDPEDGIRLGNIALLQNFLGGIDEEWFILIHVDIEAKAARALRAIPQAFRAAEAKNPTELERSLFEADSALRDMVATLERMPERCDPYIYYHRVRPYIHGWKNNPALPEGVIYEGVAEYGGQSQFFRGETGAQSSIIPSLDALLGISHEDDPLKSYLDEMRLYMPPKHRAFIAAVESGPSIRAFVSRRRSRNPSLREVYNACVQNIGRFRGLHLEYAAAYIHKQHRKEPSNPASVGTGGTPFMQYLKKHRDETARHLL